MNLRSLYGRIALVFAAILICLGAALSWIGYNAAKEHQHEVLQRVSLALAGHIAEQLRPDDVVHANSASNQALFAHLMAVNPNVEVYLLDEDGRIEQTLPASSPLARTWVDMHPIRTLEHDPVLPVLGDNPRHDDEHEIFSAAPIRNANGSIAGYVYIVLLNDMYRQMIDVAWQRYVLRSSASIAGIALLCALLIGLAAFALVTRRLQRLTGEVETFASDSTGNPALLAAQGRGDEIDRLGASFAAMRQRIQIQLAELKRQDELRRELVANVSHDLRTPLTSIQGYLETLARLGDQLSAEEQKRYLDVAVRQSHRVSSLAHQLFELARLEHEQIEPQLELFSISELVQDVAQKYALIAERKALSLSTHADSEKLFVLGDIGMIERVISNLMDNAIRHTPERGEIRLEARRDEQGIEVCVVDTGQGIAAEHLPGLLDRRSPLRMMAVQRGGGLGLLIAKRILNLHGSRISAASSAGVGTRISFLLPLAEA